MNRTPVASRLAATRRRTLLYLAILAKPGAPTRDLAQVTNTGTRTVNQDLDAMELEGLILTTYEPNPKGGAIRCAHPVAQPDPKAAKTLHDLLTPKTSRADIRSVA